MRIHLNVYICSHNCKSNIFIMMHIHFGGCLFPFHTYQTEISGILYICPFSRIKYIYWKVLPVPNILTFLLFGFRCC